MDENMFSPANSLFKFAKTELLTEAQNILRVGGTKFSHDSKCNTLINLLIVLKSRFSILIWTRK